MILLQTTNSTVNILQCGHEQDRRDLHLTPSFISTVVLAVGNGILFVFRGGLIEGYTAQSQLVG